MILVQIILRASQSRRENERISFVCEPMPLISKGTADVRISSCRRPAWCCSVGRTLPWKRHKSHPRSWVANRGPRFPHFKDLPPSSSFLHHLLHLLIFYPTVKLRPWATRNEKQSGEGRGFPLKSALQRDRGGGEPRRPPRSR